MRMLEARDFEEYAALHSDFEVTRFTTRTQLSRMDAWKHLAMIVGHWHLRGFGMWGVEELATGRLAGRVGFHQPDGWPDFELGWTIGREFWGKGYATEAARAALRHGFHQMGRAHVISLIDPQNIRSVSVALKLGETIEGQFELDGHRLIVYGIRKETFDAQL
jgi:RimJ/RimL family protein N-acetyltransferase